MDDDTRAWLEDDDLFRKEVAKGHHWERAVAQRLVAAGLHVTLGAQTVRGDVSERGQYRNEFDLLLAHKNVVAEVKSRGEEFTRPRDFPFARPFVDTVRGWDQKVRKPDIILCVSQVTGCMIGLLPYNTRKDWGVERARDHTRGITDDFYVANRSQWMSEKKTLRVLLQLQEVFTA